MKWHFTVICKGTGPFKQRGEIAAIFDIAWLYCDQWHFTKILLYYIDLFYKLRCLLVLPNDLPNGAKPVFPQI